MSATPPAVRDHRRRVVALGLMALVLAAFSPVMQGDFILLDDQTYIVNNPHIREGVSAETVRWAFAESYASNWSPLTWIAHALLLQLFGLAPYGHHLANLLLHAAVVGLLFLVLQAMTGRLWTSGLAAALFGLHPLRVESVAWAACLKDSLSGLFLVLALGAYHRAARRPGVGGSAVVAGLFAIGLMAKPSLVTLPFALLLLDLWPLGRLGRPGAFAGGAGRTAARLGALLREKVPLFVLAGVSSLLTYRAQAAWGAMDFFGDLSLGERAANALVSYATYLGTTLWPQGLAIYYPHPGRLVAPGAAAAALLLLAAVSAMAVLALRSLPWLAVGWFWFLGTLVPMIGIVQVGAQALADRYTYLAHIGLGILAAWGAAAAAVRRPRAAPAVAACCVALLGAFAMASWVNAGYWRNDLALFGRAAAVTRGNWLAHLNLGVAWGMRGDGARAREHFTEALRIRPDYPMARENLRRLEEARRARGPQGEECPLR